MEHCPKFLEYALVPRTQIKLKLGTTKKQGLLTKNLDLSQCKYVLHIIKLLEWLGFDTVFMLAKIMIT